MIDLLNLMRAALARIIQQPLPVVPAVLSFDAMAEAFLKSYEVGVKGSTLFYRAADEKKFCDERGLLVRFVKQYLIEHKLSQFFTRTLVDDFRGWLAVSAQTLREEKE